MFRQQPGTGDVIRVRMGFDGVGQNQIVRFDDCKIALKLVVNWINDDRLALARANKDIGEGR